MHFLRFLIKEASSSIGSLYSSLFFVIHSNQVHLFIYLFIFRKKKALYDYFTSRIESQYRDQLDEAQPSTSTFINCVKCTFAFQQAFFFFSSLMNSNKFYCLYTVRETKFTIHALLIEPTTTLFKKNIKNDFHDTIHIFKNYFTTVFFSFQLYQNGLILYLVDIYIYGKS